MKTEKRIFKMFGLFCLLIFFTLPAQSGQRQETFDEALDRSETEQRKIKKRRVLEIKNRIKRVREPSSVEITTDMNFEELFESGPSDPIFTENGNDYSGLNTFKSKVELESIDVDFERESKEVRSFQ